ncbi:protocadherin Fat 4 [Aplysia californica]|uniref:Protocadherin Fat 4 n=1 Tax=Aplysia californica TaxID=6500 RepID=A0ABM1A9U9_APLCA|nr:protocadherin Fat 4 [Aplysia californica]
MATSRADASIFNIEPSSGVITLNSGVDVDPAGAQTVFKPLLTDTVNPLLTLTCTDADLTSPNNDLEYSIQQGDTTKFSIPDNTVGSIFVSNALDYETTQSETVLVRVKDKAASGAQSVTASIVVTIVPVNDNAPAWVTWSPTLPGSATFAIDETVAVGTTIFTVAASDSDLDTGGIITYSITSVTDGTNPVTDAFNVDPSTGAVTTLKLFDADGSISSYILTVQGTDSSSSVTETVTVSLTDINDVEPVFSSTPFIVQTIAESSAKTGSIVTTVSATDGDKTASTFTYAVDVVQGGTVASDWAFSGTTSGQLEFKTDLDLDTGSLSLHVLKLTVKDGVSPEQTGTATLTVSIIPDNEFTPTISSVVPAQPISIAENVGSGVSVALVNAADSDTGDEGTLAFSIIGGDTDGVFSVDSSGKIATQASLDRETTDSYTLIVQVIDSGVSPKSVTTSVSVTISDVTDNAPTCSPSYYTKELSETSSANTVVVTISCSDEDTGDTLSYSVKSPHDTNFGFTTPTNELKLISTTGFDYDSATQSYNVEVEVTDSTYTSTVKVRVNVGANNDHTPAFSSNPVVTVAENSLSDPLYTYTADDADFSPHGVTSYTINAVTNSGQSLFGIDSSSGVISMLSTLDYDTLPAGDKTYELEVVAEDGGGLTGTGTVTVSVTDINDNAPTCTYSTFTHSMDESQSGTAPFTVVTLGCTDVEDGTSLTYSMVQTPGSHFSVAADVVTLTANTLDYETSTIHTLTITVTDAGGAGQSSTVTVYVNVNNVNEAGPTFPSYAAVSIDEDVGVQQSVAVVTATDPDGSDPSFGDLQYSILSGDSSSQFSIDATTALLKTRKALDFETKQTYDLVIQAIERGGTNSATVTQVVNISDKNDEFPVCSPNTLAETVGEDEVATYEIKDFGCTDADAGTTLTYTITSGDTSLFEMSGSKLRLKSALDYDTTQTHDLTVLVSDGDVSHDTTISGTVTVGSVDEGQPSFATAVYNANVNEASAVSTLVTTVSASDPDINLDQHGQIKYSFASTYANFAIDQSSGQITIAKLLDREAATTHTLIVKAADATGFNTATVSVTVLDSNDNSPAFTTTSYSASVSETDASGTTVLTVAANDLDDPLTSSYGSVSYSLSGSSSFQIDASTGEITTTAVLDADAAGTTSYVLTVLAVDSGGAAGALTGSAQVTVSVTTDNQHDPVFSPATYAVTITESQFAVGDKIVSATASDQDTGLDGDLSFAFVGVQTKFTLTQNGNEAEVRLAQTLDFDAGDTSFTLQIRASDNGVPVRTALTTVTVTVDDVNDNSPLCTSVVNVDVTEGQTAITTLVCSDADPGTTLSYTIVSTTPNTITPAVDVSGVVTVATALDYENADSHTILIKVEDDGATVLSTTVTVNLRISDLNDNDPTLSGSFAFTVSEADTASSTALYTAVASSNDGPSDTVTYSLTDTTYFDISSVSGEITLKTDAPDFETIGASYSMDVCAKDTANPTVRSACQTITVTVTDVNDVVPEFSPSVYTDSIREDASIGDSVTSVTAVDTDTTTAFKTITFSILSGNTGSVWDINNAGSVFLAGALDYETVTSYALVVQASDDTNSATVTYNIVVTSVNDFDPAFGSTTLTINIDENTAIGTTVTVSALPATDDDDGSDGVFTYSIDSGPLAIDPDTGAVTVVQALDRETTTSYTLNIRATDQGAPARTGTLVLTVDVNDLNDVTPSCASNVYFVTLPETAAPGDAVQTLVCTDDDDTSPNNALTYSIVSGDAGLFVVDSSGQVTVSTGAAFDRETTASYSLIVDVVDQATSSKLTYTATVSVTISDVNDNDPVFTSLPATVTKLENTAVGTTLTTVPVTDADSGTNGEFFYQITSGNSEGKFSIDPVAGHVVLVDSLDFETTTSYQLELTATDKGASARSSSGTLTVSVADVSDTAPVCSTSLYTATVAENSVSLPVVTVTCTDADAGDTITYSITAGDTASDFDINPNTGAVSTAAAAAISYESTQSFTLTVTASDGTLTDTTTVLVTVTDVNEFSPQFSPSSTYTASVSEAEAVGFTVETVAATDQDTFDSIRIYSITGGNTAGKFAIDSFSGKIELKSPLDHETATSYSLTLQVEDSGGSVSSGTLDVTVTDINDNDPQCTVTATAVSVDEAAVAGVIFTPTCSDKDTAATPTLEYSITSGAHASLSIDSTTGAISVIADLDYEAATSHDLVITVSDKDTPTPRTTDISLTISVNPVNEDTPVFTSAGAYGPYDVAEDTTVGTSIASVSASDGDTGLEHGTVRYSIVSGDTQQQFAVDESSGDISVVKSLDRETTASYILTVRATDDALGAATAKSADATVTVTVTDVNDNSPTFSPAVYTVDVIETASFGPTVVLKQVTVQDGDDGANAATTVSITSGNGEGKFSMSGNDLILSAALDYETTQSFSLVLEVSDGGSPPLKNAAQVTVNVLADNEQAPLMSDSTFSTSIAEDTAVGTLVYDANATDSDSGTHGTITYSIDSGVTGSEFILDSGTGELFVGSALDFDVAPASYAIVIKATDGGGLSDATTSTVSLSVDLTDVNDNYPQFTTTMFVFNVNENVGTSTTVGTVVANDADTGVNGDVTYTKIAGSGTAYFDINSSSGAVTVAGAIDYESFQVTFKTPSNRYLTHVFYLTVTAHDGGTPSLTSTGLVKIEVNNKNDNDPVITPQEFAVVLQESTVVGTSVLQYTVSDQDTDLDGFSLATADSYFQVDAATGDVTTKAELDRETVATHTIYVQVIDKQTSSDSTVRTSTATLTIVVEDTNDNTPVITGTYTPSVSEDASINQLVFQVTATDDDAGANAQLVYDITAGNTGSAFTIDSVGNVQVAQTLDRETVSSYMLTVMVSDQGNPVRSNQIVATVTITDVNDNDPVFNPAAYSMNVNENSNVATPVGTVTATDADTGVNAALTYSFDSFTQGLQSHFAIDGASGAITVASTDLDRETSDTYVARVKVTDAGTPLSRTAYTDVTITIDDLNDNAPVFSSNSYTGSVDEGSALTTSIAQVSATDLDIGVNKDITYTIDTALLDGPTADTFIEVDSSTGEISPKADIDYETHQSFTFIVVATDGGAPALSATTTVTVTINDVNDNSPVFTQTFYNTEIAYTGSCDSSITQVTATDADSGDNARISYSLQANTDDYLFSVNIDTGVLSLQSVAATNTRYTQVIQASDNGIPVNTAATGATVRVDTFVPNTVIVTFKLGVSRATFVAQQTTFLTNLQTVVRNTYPTALARLWCIQEYSGTTASGDNPVNVHLYIVKDDSSESQANINTDKTFLTQDEFRALVAANAEGDPGSAIQGSAWDPFSIISVSPYYEETDSWWDTLHGKVITAIAAALGLTWIAILTYMIVRVCNTRNRPLKTLRTTPRLTEVHPVTPPKAEKPKPMVHRGAWDTNTGIVPDKDSNLPNRKAFPPMLLTDPLTGSNAPPNNTRRHSPVESRHTRSPRNMIISPSDLAEPPSYNYSIMNRAFDGKALDPVTGKMYEFNTRTNERRWLD